MAASIIICGFLTKEGARGHRVQNSKKRWFVLSDAFLSYYEDNPINYKGKAVNNFKGRMFLCGCFVKDHEKANSFLFQTPTKDFIITCASEQDARCWKNALTYAIETANVDFEDVRDVTGWCYKKGGVGHKYTNWQKRWWKLQGSLLSYFSDECKKSEESKYLKGSIDVTLISELTPDVQGSKENCFSILVNNEREFLISCSTPQEKQNWIDSIITTKEILARRYGFGRLGVKEEVQATMLTQLRTKGWKKTCLCLTNKNIRFYNSKRILDDEDDWDFLSGLIMSIPLLGTTLSAGTKNGSRIININDIRGNKYFIQGRNDELMNIYEQLTTGISSLLTDIINEGNSIRLNCYVSPQGETDEQGYTIISLNQTTATFRFLLSTNVIEINFNRMIEVTVEPTMEIFMIRYEDNDESIKELSFRSESAFSLADIFNNLRGETVSILDRWDSVTDTTNNTHFVETAEEPIQRKKGKEIVLDDFELIRVVGRGAFGKVLLCRLAGTEKVYAMKSILKKSLVRHQKEIEHTLAERSVMMQLDHPFLMKLHFTFQTDDKLIYIMDYVNGGELFFHLEREGTFDIERSKFYLAELVSALAYLHSRDIVYRDIKTENILLNHEGHVVLTDFGLSKELETPEDRTGTLCGTPVYLPPEMLKKQVYGKAVDFWSIGVLFFEMLTGDVPFYNDNIQKMFRMIVQDPVPFPPHLEGTLAADLINQLLQKEPEERLTNFEIMKMHPFFEGFDWDALERKEIQPPFVPMVTSELDTRNVDEDIINETVDFDVADGDLTQEEKNLFKDLDFGYVGPAADF